MRTSGGPWTAPPPRTLLVDPDADEKRAAHEAAAREHGRGIVHKGKELREIERKLAALDADDARGGGAVSLSFGRFRG